MKCILEELAWWPPPKTARRLCFTRELLNFKMGSLSSHLPSPKVRSDSNENKLKDAADACVHGGSSGYHVWSALKLFFISVS